MSKSASSSITVLDALVRVLERAARYNRNAEVAPMAVLWPDGDSHWQGIVAQMRERLPILTLGAYDAAVQTGPAIWVRAVLATRHPDAPTPVVYLPGLRKDVFRNVEDAPEEIQPLLYLQYRGTMFLQPNGKDWTLPAFFQNAQQGLGIHVDGGDATRTALIATAPALLGYPVEQLRSRPGGLAVDDLYEILLPDMPRRILEWLNDAAGTQAKMDTIAWNAFSHLLQLTFGVHPGKDGPIAGARLLGSADFASPWMEVWRRFAENPIAYPNIPGLLRGAKPAKVAQRTLFDPPPSDFRWPQDHEEQEDALRRTLLALETKQIEPHQAIAELEHVHAPRRASVWAKLGQAPLALALEHLAAIATAAKAPFPAGSVASMTEHYTTEGWKVDAAMLDACASVTRKDDIEAVSAALDAIYSPWLWSAAERFQDAIKHEPPQRQPTPRSAPDGTVVLFADGLRYDLAARMTGQMIADGLNVDISAAIGPVPGITSSAKRAQTPVTDLLAPGAGFNLVVAGTGTALNQPGMKKLIAQKGWQVLDDGDTGTPGNDQRAWAEQGEIDSYGHSHPRDLPKHARNEVQRIRARVAELLDAGWSRIEIVTDHGWLLTPEPMPKTDLPASLASDKKGRCARLNPGATPSVQTVPWCWDPEVLIAVARGASCFEEGKRYEHGGLSPQESIIPTIRVTSTASPATASVGIAAIRWSGLRCIVTLDGGASDVSADIRRRAGDASTSLAARVQRVGADGEARILMEDDAHEGTPAIVVILNSSGHPIAQRATIVGEG